MVERTSTPFVLNDPGSVQASELSLGAGRLDQVQAETPDLADQVVGTLLQVGGALAKKGVDMSAQMSYIQGQRAAMAGQAEASVEGDAASRPFIHGGYQDEDYRIEQAKMARDLNEFIKTTGAAMSPTDFAQVVGERASAFSGKFDALSMRGQLQALTSQQKLEEGLFTAQAQSYQQFVIAEGSKRFTAQGNQIMTDLVQASTPAQKQAQMERAALFYTDLLTTDRLPMESRTKMATEYLGALANADQRAVVEQLRQGGALDSLSFAERKSLDTALRESQTRTEAQDALGVVAANADLESRVATGTIGADELNSYINTEVVAKRMSYDQAKKLQMSFLKGLSNQDDMQAVMAAVGDRDLNRLAALGFTGAEGIEQMDKQLAANGVGLTQRLQAGLSVGMDIGQLPKSFGETVGMSVRAIAGADPKEPVNAQLVDALNSVVSTLTVASQKNRGARGVLLAQMPDDTKAAMTYALQQQEFGVPPADSIREFVANRDAFAKLDVLQQSLQTQKFRKAALDRVDSELSSGFTGRIGNAITGQSNLSTNSYNRSAFAAELQLELGRITGNRDNMGINEETALDMAVDAVQARTIQVGAPGFFGTGEARRSLVMPAGVNVEQVFGSNDKVQIGRILNEQYPPTDGFESGFRYNIATGVLENIQIDDRGIVVAQQKVDPLAVGTRIRAVQMQVTAEAQAAHFGEAVELDGQTFKLDGGNTYGIPVRLAYNFRKELAGFEGLRLNVYKDRNGLAVGVGRNVTGTGLKEGDSITKEQAEQWFREDTDKAMNAGRAVADDLGVIDPSAIAGISGAIFQLGAAGFDDHKRTSDAIRNKDYNTFVKEVKSSEWAKQTPNRVDWFISKMAGHFAP